jgi:hypothetical protein
MRKFLFFFKYDFPKEIAHNTFLSIFFFHELFLELVLLLDIFFLGTAISNSKNKNNF